MYDEYELTESTDLYGYSQRELMVSDRITWCPMWHHYKQWVLAGSGYVDDGHGDCNPPPLNLINERDFVPIDAIALILGQ